MYNFFVIDDHPVVRSFLKNLITDNYINSTILEADSEMTCLSLLENKDFNLIILDLNMPDSDPIRLLESIKRENKTVPILIYTSNEEDSFSFRLLKLGIKGYLTKWASDEEVLQAIESTLNNKFYVSDIMKEKLAEFVVENKNYSNPFDRLSSKEFEIALAMLKGLTAGEICLRFNIKPGSLSLYKTKIFSKLEIKDNCIVGFVKLGIKFKVI